MVNVTGIEVSGTTYDLEDTTARNTASSASSVATQASDDVSTLQTTVNNISDSIDTISDDLQTVQNNIGDLADLDTTVKTDIVSALNEVNGKTFSEVTASFSITGSWAGTLTAIRHKSLVALQLQMDDNSLSPGTINCTISSLSTFFNDWQKVRGVLFTNGGISCGTFVAVSSTSIRFIITYDSSGDDEGFDSRITMIYDPS